MYCIRSFFGEIFARNGSVSQARVAVAQATAEREEAQRAAKEIQQARMTLGHFLVREAVMEARNMGAIMQCRRCGVQGARER